MNTPRSLHRQAMEFAFETMEARESGDVARARQLAAEALPLEIQAVEMLEKIPASEPTRSILYLSAASLAYQAGRYDEALALIAEGQSGWPPPRTAFDLHELKIHVTALRDAA